MEIKYFRSSDISLPLKIKILDIEGVARPDDFLYKCELDYSDTWFARDLELFVEAQIFALGQPLGIPERSSFRCFSGEVKWTEWLSFSMKLRDLPKSAQVLITVWNAAPNGKKDEVVPFGGTMMPLFTANGLLRTGRQKLFLWKDLLANKNKTHFRPKTLSDLQEFEEILNSYHHKRLPRVDWLDKLVYKRIESLMNTASANPKQSFSANEKSPMYINIEIPNCKFPVVFHENVSSSLLEEIKSTQPVDEKSGMPSLRLVYDPEAFLDNPIEDKYILIQRSGHNLDEKEIKPSVYERDQLEKITRSSDRNLKGSEKELLHRFRYTLLDNPKVLTKFLRCVRWNSQEETSEALSLMYKWKKISTSDALELLCPFFQNQKVRDYGVSILAEARDEELQLYLLQLVQAIKFESSYPSSLSQFLILRCSENLELANFFFWYVTVEKQAERHGPRFTTLLFEFLSVLSSKPAGSDWSAYLRDDQSNLLKRLLDFFNNLKALSKVQKMKEQMKSYFIAEFRDLVNFPKPVLHPLKPEILLDGIKPENCSVFKSAKVPLKLAFKRYPSDQGSVVLENVIFKSGDDLRQDQLIIQMIMLMEKIFKSEGLDLKLSPYKVLATSPRDGYLELVEQAHNVSMILKEHDNMIVNFLMKQASKPSHQAEYLENYIRSCAGYCVITFVLGIGDRHLDNILIRENGQLFHIDFGFIFGKDPKPLPPKVRLITEMIDAMGGFASSHYYQFLNYCFSAYSVLRKNANLFLNLVSLMCDSGIPDLQNDFDGAMMRFQERFRLDLEDEEANEYLLQVMLESMNAFSPKLMEEIHKVMTRLR